MTQGLLSDAAIPSESLATDQSQDLGGKRIQMEILEQLKVSHRLDVVENQVAATAQQTVQASISGVDTGKLSTDIVLSISIKIAAKVKSSDPLM